MKHLISLSVVSLASFLIGAVAAPEPAAKILPVAEAPAEVQAAPVQNPGAFTITLGVPTGTKAVLLVSNSGHKVYVKLEPKFFGVAENEKPD